MANFPSKWFDFVNQKELKRLRKDINNTKTFKIQVLVSVIIAIVSMFFNQYVGLCPLWAQILICVLLCLIVILVFLFPLITNSISKSKSCNVYIEGKKATEIFDEEITYSIMVASEYFQSLTLTSSGPLSSDLKNFYMIEIHYYVIESLKKISDFNSNLPGIFGEKENQITLKRAKNLIALIDNLILNAKLNIPKNLNEKYVSFKNFINS